MGAMNPYSKGWDAGFDRAARLIRIDLERIARRHNDDPAGFIEAVKAYSEKLPSVTGGSE